MLSPWLSGHLSLQGQYCDICTAANSNKAHPVSNAIDGTERWWQSPPLSRGLEYNEVNVTLDLGQVGFVFFLSCFRHKIIMGLVRSPSGETKPGAGRAAGSRASTGKGPVVSVIKYNVAAGVAGEGYQAGLCQGGP